VKESLLDAVTGFMKRQRASRCLLFIEKPEYWGGGVAAPGLPRETSPQACPRRTVWLKKSAAQPKKIEVLETGQHPGRF